MGHSCEHTGLFKSLEVDPEHEEFGAYDDDGGFDDEPLDEGEGGDQDFDPGEGTSGAGGGGGGAHNEDDKGRHHFTHTILWCLNEQRPPQKKSSLLKTPIVLVTDKGQGGTHHTAFLPFPNFGLVLIMCCF